MTLTNDVAINCDGTPGMQPFECTTHPVRAATAPQARALARARGWKTGRRCGRTVDLCPDHQT